VPSHWRGFPHFNGARPFEAGVAPARSCRVGCSVASRHVGTYHGLPCAMTIRPTERGRRPLAPKLADGQLADLNEVVPRWRGCLISGAL
jgi:hypothetical protein